MFLDVHMHTHTYNICIYIYIYMYVCMYVCTLQTADYPEPKTLKPKAIRHLQGSKRVYAHSLYVYMYIYIDKHVCKSDPQDLARKEEYVGRAGVSVAAQLVLGITFPDTASWRMVSG